MEKTGKKILLCLTIVLLGIPMLYFICPRVNDAEAKKVLNELKNYELPPEQTELLDCVSEAGKLVGLVEEVT